MDEEVRERGDAYRIYTTDRPGLSVPYLPTTDVHGRRDHGYVDLRDKPDAVARIPEADGQPGLTLFLQQVNAPGKGLMSLSASVEAAKVRAGAAAPENGQAPTDFIDSTVVITFREPDLATGHNVLVVARRLMEVRQADPREWASYDLGIQPLRSLFGIGNLAGLTIRIRAMGANEASAWQNFNFHWSQLAAAVRKLKLVPAAG